MKKLLLILLVSLGLQTQAQINLCDSMTASGAQTQLVLQVNNVNTFIDYWCTNSTCGSLLGEDSMSLYLLAGLLFLEYRSESKLKRPLWYPQISQCLNRTPLYNQF